MGKRKKKGKLKLIIIAVVIVAIVAVVVVMKNKQKPTGTAVSLGKSLRGDITSVVTATGKIYPEIEVKISSEVSGEIVDLPVTDGMIIEKGMLLVRVNPDTLEAQVKQQEAAFSATKANSAQAKAQMLKAELDLKRTENLFEKGFATQDELDNVKTGVEVAKASYDASVFRIKQQEMQLKEASDELGKATTFAPISGTITALNSELGDRVVGTGQFAGTEIMRLANLDNMEVRVDVAEAEIVDIKIGDKAKIEIDAFPDETFRGTVKEIANSAKTSRSGSQEQLTTFQVKVRLDDGDSRYRPGMTATADIETETKEGVVLVPLQSVTVRQRAEVQKQLNPKSKKGKGEKDDAKATTDRADTDSSDQTSEDESKGEKQDEDGKDEKDALQRVVFVVKDGKAVLTPVETGLSDNKHLEILSGLDEDLEIVTGSYGVLTRTLKHDSIVREKKFDKSKGKKGKK